jgi:hypothetical protein
MHDDFWPWHAVFNAVNAFAAVDMTCCQKGACVQTCEIVGCRRPE